MNRKKRIIVEVIIIIILLIGFVACQKKSEATYQVDNNMITLKDLINEEELCDEAWALKFRELGQKMKEDANREYLSKYYRKIDQEFIKKYDLLGQDSIDFSTKFLAKDYAKAKVIIKAIKEKFIIMEDNSYEEIY